MGFHRSRLILLLCHPNQGPQLLQAPLSSTTKQAQDFPGGPVAKTPCSQCRGPRFNPWSGNYIPQAEAKISSATTKTWCSQINKYYFLIKKEKSRQVILPYCAYYGLNKRKKTQNLGCSIPVLGTEGALGKHLLKAWEMGQACQKSGVGSGWKTCSSMRNTLTTGANRFLHSLTQPDPQWDQKHQMGGKTDGSINSTEQRGQLVRLRGSIV